MAYHALEVQVIWLFLFITIVLKRFTARQHLFKNLAPNNDVFELCETWTLIKDQLLHLSYFIFPMVGVLSRGLGRSIYAYNIWYLGVHYSHVLVLKKLAPNYGVL